jgi:hypothetical protein
MNLNIKIFLLCPVPDDQKPINEYISLKKNPFTNWIRFSNKKYLKKIITTFFLFIIGFSLLKINEFHFDSSIGFLFEKLFVNSLVFLCVFFGISLSPWKKIQKQLDSTRIFYEEASWFDGQVWEKPFSILKNDRLLKTQKILPVMVRSQKILIRLILFVSFLLIFS